ncbi:MAG TPA: 50S ribosomal protein L4 [Desulfatiglandales bacterium]|nr:50S ribosomal protein L4 [Desulfatiglandales bacterium]
MKVIDVYNLQAEKSSRMELNADIFGVPVRKEILHQVVVSQLNNRRSGTASTKSRSKVKRSGKKLWRQKGTGRARVGDAASPTRRGGGVVFGPTPRRYIKKVTKKLRKAALFMALTDKVISERLFVVEDFNLPEIKTRNLVQIMKNFEADKALIVIEEKNENLEKSSQNIHRIKVMRYQGLNVYDILKYDHLFLVRSVIPKIEEALIS